MNYLAHGSRFVEDPYFMAGTAVPDWLSVVDRKARIRTKHTVAHVAADDPTLAAVARGVAQHLFDDAWFHETRAFAELNWQLSVLAKQVLPNDEGFRPSFLGHILVEILLDDALIAQQPGTLVRYYRAMEQVDAARVAEAVNQMSPRPVAGLETFIPRFIRERFLCDYADDGKLLFRLNQVMRRLEMPQLPETFASIFPECRRLVNERSEELMRPDQAKTT